MTYCKQIPFNIQPKKFGYVTDQEISENIIYMACCFFCVTREQLTGLTRKREIVEARQISQVLIKNRTRFSLARIGSIFDRDHTSVIHSIQTVSDLCDSDDLYKERFHRFSNIIAAAS